MKGKNTFQSLSSQAILNLYDRLHQGGLVSFPSPASAEYKIQAIVSNITGASFGVPHYPTVEEKIVAYLYYIINDHVFIDGNKRTAAFTFLVLCELNSLIFFSNEYTLDQLVIFLEQDKREAHETIRLVANDCIIQGDSDNPSWFKKHLLGVFR